MLKQIREFDFINISGTIEEYWAKISPPGVMQTHPQFKMWAKPQMKQSIHRAY